MKKYLKKQFEKTEGFRRFIYRRINIVRYEKILEIGCGDGALMDEIEKKTGIRPFGIDVSPGKQKNMIKARVEELPFRDRSFSLVLLHFVFMWIKNREKALKEIRRVLEKNGVVVFLAEPDYGGRIEYPDTGTTNLWIEALKMKNADPFTGRKIKYYLEKYGFKAEVGVFPLLEIEDEEDMDFPAEVLGKKFKKNRKLVYLPLFYGIGVKNG